jgi:predicted AAA+ superfamily ATPase
MDKNKLTDFGSKTEKPTTISRMKEEGVLWLHEKVPKSEFVQWAIADTGKYKAQTKTLTTLTPGFYAIEFDDNSVRPIFSSIAIKIDNLVRIKNSIADSVLNEIDTFWNTGEKFKKLGFLHYRGYLLYGAHGSGKTSLVHLITKDVIENGGIVFVCKDPEHFIQGMSEFRAVEPTRPAVCLFEDIDAIIKKNGEDKILAFLDGEYKVNTVLNIATTNYPEVLDKRIVSRPRRFDRVIKIEYPDKLIRKEYLKTKLDKSEVDLWVKETENLSFASLAELVVSVKCLGNSFETTVKLLKNMQLKRVSSEEDKEEIGFGTKDEK